MSGNGGNKMDAAAMLAAQNAAMTAAIANADTMQLFVSFIQKGMNIDQQCTVIANLLLGLSTLNRADGQPLPTPVLKIRNSAKRALDEFMLRNSDLIAPADDLIGSRRG